MRNKRKLRIGSKLIERGKVYRIFRITRVKNGEKHERVIHYRPYFKNAVNNTLICSIPECSMDDVDMRRPITKKEVGQVLAYLSKRSRNNEELDAIGAKITLNLNDIYKTAEVLKNFWKEKRKKDVNLSKTKRDVLASAINRMVEEIALVIGIPIDNARQRITVALDNYPN